MRQFGRFYALYTTNYALTPMFQIETDRLLLRVFREDDLPAYQQNIYGDADVTTYMAGGAPRPIERTLQTLRYFVQHQVEHGFSVWAVTEKATGDFVGHGGLCYLGDTGDVEIAYAFGKDYWGKGYATEVARASLRFGFEHGGLAIIHALANTPNIPSQKVMQKLGMTHEGLTTRYHGGEALELYTITREAFQPGDAYFQVTLEEST